MSLGLSIWIEKGKAQARLLFGLTAGSLAGMAEMHVHPLLKFFFGKGSALDARAVIAYCEVDFAFPVKVAYEAHCGLLLAAAASELDPLIEGEPLEPFAHGGAPFPYELFVLPSEEFQLAAGANQIWNNVGHLEECRRHVGGFFGLRRWRRVVDLVIAHDHF